MSTQKILLVEDDHRLAALVKDYLESNAFDVQIESDGLQVASKVEAYNPDLIILDVNLPGKNGLEICKDIREEYSGIILMLTARNDDIDQVLGLEFGADDYVIKPVEPRVLLARIRALLRRSSAENKPPQEAFTFGSLTIQTESRTVLLNQSPVTLSSHEYDLLLVLAKQAGEILSREYLFKTVYGRAYDGLDRSVDVRISHLRKKMGDSADTPFRIKTIWGRGYLFVPDAWQNE